MADLQARLGPKVFPNKSWTRPGYDVSAKKHPSWTSKHKNISAPGYESDSSSHEDHLISDRTGSTRSRIRTEISLLQRMGLSPEGSENDELDLEEDTGTQHAEKSLIERVGIVTETLNGRSFSDTPVGSSVLWAPKDDTEEMDLGSDDDDKGNISEKEGAVNSALTDKNVDPVSVCITSLDKEHHVNGHGGRSSHDDGPDNTRVEDGRDARTSFACQEGGSASQPRPISLQPPEHLLFAQKSVRLPEEETSKTVDMIQPNANGQSSRSEGEVSESNDVRNILLTLVEKNAQGRLESEAGIGSPSAQVPSSVVTNEAVTLLDSEMRNVATELRAQEPEARPRKMIAAGLQSPSHATSMGILPANERAVSLAESTSESLPGSSRLDHFSAKLAYGTNGPSLRYTPSPQRPERSSSRHRRSPVPANREYERDRGRDRDYEPHRTRAYRRTSRDYETYSSRRRSPVHFDRSVQESEREHYRERTHEPRRTRTLTRQARSRSPIPLRPRTPYIPKQQRALLSSPSSKASRSPGRRHDSHSPPRRRDSTPPSRGGKSPLTSKVYQRRSTERQPYDPSQRPTSMTISIPDAPLDDQAQSESQSHASDNEKPKTRPVIPYVQETPSHVMTLPCHSVPGLWFAKLAANEVGILTCEFEIDQYTATKWSLPRHSSLSMVNGLSSKPMDRSLSLQICCFLTQDIQAAIEKLGDNATPQAIAETVSSLEQSWPHEGHLIVSVNANNKIGKTWLPDKLGPNFLPLQIEQYAIEGHNCVQFIQLSPMNNIFVLLAMEKGEKGENAQLFHDILLPLQDSWQDTIIGGIKPAVLTIL